jgi:hypothetical protein
VTTLSLLQAKLHHLVARAALSTRPPLQAKRLVDLVGRLLPRVEAAAAGELSAALEGSGTCLTRALTVASRVPGAEVVIAATPARVALRGADRISEGGPALYAHAWVEIHGVSVGERPPSAVNEIARLR